MISNDVSLRVSVSGGSYRIQIGSGILKQAFSEIDYAYRNKNVFIITDSHILGLYQKKIISSMPVALKERCTFYSFPAGEKSKSRKQKENLENFLFQRGVNRNTLLIAFGGGVTGDLCGFTASTMLRGIPFIQFPTSVIAMVDSSVGGKTGIDTSWGKNLLGTFYQPKAVYIDVDLLSTLPELEYRSGLAEVIKCACIKCSRLFQYLVHNKTGILMRDTGALVRLIHRCLEIKSEVVGKDEKETGGYRKILNFGHTFAHAFELFSNFRINHGNAVGLGMALEARIAADLNLLIQSTYKKITALIRAYGLPDAPPPALWAGIKKKALAKLKPHSAPAKKKLKAKKTSKAVRASRIAAEHRAITEMFYDTMLLDKKSQAGSVYMSLITDIGKPDRGDGSYSRKILKRDIAAVLPGLTGGFQNI